MKKSFLSFFILFSFGCDRFYSEPISLPSDAFNSPSFQEDCIEREEVELSRQLSHFDYLFGNQVEIKMDFWVKCILPYIGYLGSSMRDRSFRGKYQDRFNLSEIDDLGNRFFPGEKLSYDFLSSFMHLKSLLIGGNKEFITQIELDNSVSLIQFLNQQTSLFFSEIGLIWYGFWEEEIFYKDKNGRDRSVPLFLERSFYRRFNRIKENTDVLLEETARYIDQIRFPGEEEYSFVDLRNFFYQMKIELVRQRSKNPSLSKEEVEKQLALNLPFFFDDLKREFLFSLSSFMMNLSHPEQVSREDWMQIFKGLLNAWLAFRRVDYYIKGQEWSLKNSKWESAFTQTGAFSSLHPRESLREVKTIFDTIIHIIDFALSLRQNPSLSDKRVGGLFKSFFKILLQDELILIHLEKEEDKLRLLNEIDYPKAWRFFYKAFLEEKSKNKTYSSTGDTFQTRHLLRLKEQVGTWYQVQIYIESFFSSHSIDSSTSPLIDHKKLLDRIKSKERALHFKERDSGLNEEEELLLKGLEGLRALLDTALVHEDFSTESTNFSLATIKDGRLWFNGDSGMEEKEKSSISYSFRSLSFIHGLNFILSLFFETNFLGFFRTTASEISRLGECDLKAMILGLEKEDSHCIKESYKEEALEFFKLVRLFLPAYLGEPQGDPYSYLVSFYRGLYPFSNLFLPGSDAIGAKEESLALTLNKKEILQCVWILISSFYWFRWAQENFLSCRGGDSSLEALDRECFWEEVKKSAPKRVNSSYPSLFSHMPRMESFIQSMTPSSFERFRCYLERQRCSEEDLANKKEGLAPDIGGGEIVGVFLNLMFLEGYFYRFNLDKDKKTSNGPDPLNTVIELYELWRSLEVLVSFLGNQKNFSFFSKDIGDYVPTLTQKYLKNSIIALDGKEKKVRVLSREEFKSNICFILYSGENFDWIRRRGCPLFFDYSSFKFDRLDVMEILFEAKKALFQTESLSQEFH